MLVIEAGAITFCTYSWYKIGSGFLGELANILGIHFVDITLHYFVASCFGSL